MAKVTKEQAEGILNKGAKNVAENDLRKVLNKQKEIESKFKGNGLLGRYVADVKLLFALIKDYVNGDYREVPWRSIAAIVVALLYVLNPIDVIPDFIPGVGYVDDTLVVATCLAMIETDLHKYRNWRTKTA